MRDTLATLPLDALTVADGERPKAPPIEGATDRDRAAGHHLAVIHRHYLMDLGRIARLMQRIEAGDAPPEDLADIVLHSDMARNLSAFGSICGQACHVLKMHHDIEEGHMFPGIHGPAGEGIRAVVERLRREHEVIHELLNRLAAAAQDCASEPTEEHFAALRDVYAKLFEQVRSHFRYEETELQEAIGVYLGGV
jgi:iron-sulfur cluster repair protein YtfE (RIC family)